MIQIIFDYERGSRKNLLAFGVRVSLRKGTRSLEMETDNRVSVMENLEIEVEWCHCFEYLRLQHLGFIGIFLLSYGLCLQSIHSTLSYYVPFTCKLCTGVGSCEQG